MILKMQSYWARANACFRNKDYESAIKYYEEAILQAEPPLKTRIRFNLDIALRRAGKMVAPYAVLEKPEDLDQFYFDLIKDGGFFDPEWYLEQYKEKHHVTGNPLAHYLAHGVELGTNPSPQFDTTYYLKQNQDVAQSGIHPFLHYICQGCNEGRLCRLASVQDSLETYQAEAPHYVSRLAEGDCLIEKAVRVITFYLPQYHPIPENDEWWGNGFTEWTNVRPARPLFEGHYQPHEPDEFLGYYDLRDTSVMRKQIELAKQYGIEGFCFYTYWFSGTRLLETPVDNYLADNTLDLPFCICWANENWSRRWDGKDSDLLMVQHYSDQDDIAFISHMAKYLRDPRYIRVNGKPLLIVYRPNLFPSMSDTAMRWRDCCREIGLGEIYIAYVQSFEKRDPSDYGLDAAIEFPPNNSAPPDITKNVVSARFDFSGRVYDWRIFLQRSENFKLKNYPVLRGVCPSWDNTPRKKGRGTVFANSSPNLFERWLTNVFEDTVQQIEDVDQRIVFVNAWNEWGEGAHLEPDQRYGYAWLQAVRNAHKGAILGIARHSFLIEWRWNTIKSIFNGMPNRKLYGFLGDYVSLIKQGKRHGVEYQLIEGRPSCLINGESVCVDTRDKMSVIHRNIFKVIKYCFVVLQFNKSELTIACVRSLQKLEKYGLDVVIIIVDNNSDASHVAVIEQEFGENTDVVILLSGENKGFSGGNNIGYRYARNQLHAQFCVVLNNDTEIEQSDFIEKSIDLYYQYSYSLLGPDVLISDGRHENPWNDYIYSIHEFKHLHEIRNAERKRFAEGAPPSFKKIGKSTACSDILMNPLLQGAAYVVSPIFIADHENLFDERLFLYGEEFLLATECLINGDLCVYTKKLVVKHHEGATTDALPSYQKMMHGYDSAIRSIELCLARLERKREALLGRVINHDDHHAIRNIVAAGGNHVLIDLLFCQPGYHGGGEYGKAVFKKLAEVYAERGGFELWAAINPSLFIDQWVWEFCRNYGINVVAVNSYDDIIRLINADIFYSFFTPAIVVYTGYEYMKRVGGCLPFTCVRTRVIGTLHDIRDYELSRDYEKILVARKRVGCVYESALTGRQWNRIVDEKRKMADDLRTMYAGIISDSKVQIITISKYCENSIHQNIGAPVNPIKVWMSPMKPRPNPVKPDMSALGIGDSDFVLILHAGRFEKNAASAVRALDMLFKETSSYRYLKVILTGVDNISETGLGEITFVDNFVPVGELMPETLEYLLNKAKLLVYPSFNEGLGYPPIEAMSYATRCVASNITAIPEICENAIEYFDPFDVLSIKQALVRSLQMKYVDNQYCYARYQLIRDSQNSGLDELCIFITSSPKQVTH